MARTVYVLAGKKRRSTMKRWLWILAAAWLPACGGGGNVEVGLGRDGSSAAQTASLASLEDAQSVRLAIAEVQVHLAPMGAETETESEASGDWHTFSPANQQVDLVALPIDGSTFLGEVSLPAGKITQIRLRVAGTEGQGGERLLAGAVTDVDGMACDLILPASAWEPGLKIIHPFKAIDVDPAQRIALVLAFDLRDATRSREAAGCVWRLNPVLELQSSQVVPGPLDRAPGR
jgi:hypothetical protein